MKPRAIALSLCLTAIFSQEGRTRDIAREPSGEAAHPTARARLPLPFELNRGQSPSDVFFAARGNGYRVHLTQTGAVLMVASTPVRMTFTGARRSVCPAGIDELPGKTNYLRGRDASAWHTNIPTYAKVIYDDLYPGIDLVYYGRDYRIEYDLVVAPGTDPAQIVISFEGMDDIDLTTDGDLVLRVDGRELRQQSPVAYQNTGDTASSRRPVDSRYVLRSPREVAFEIGAYDKTKPLVIDPVLTFASYLGGSGADTGEAIALDLDGNAYLTGATASADFPVTTGPALASALEDVFVVKVSPDGGAIVYATYLGGDGADAGQDIAVDAAGRVVVAGRTRSADFPTRNAIQAAFGGQTDAFVAKLSAAGDEILFSTYLGGSLSDSAEAVALDLSGHTYVTGFTRSLEFPTLNAYQPQLGGFPPPSGGSFDPQNDAFLAKLDPSGSSFVYSTYLGGVAEEFGHGIAVNAEGNVFIVGSTESVLFPSVNPFQPALLGFTDAFVTKFSQDGQSLVYSSHLGGTGVDSGHDIAVDLFDRATVVGEARSFDFPTKRAIQDTSPGRAGFITTISANGRTILFSSYLTGSTASTIAEGVAVDPLGNIFVTGRTFATDFPLVDPLQDTAGGNFDAFVAKIHARTRRLVFSTYLGGSASDASNDIKLDSMGNAWVIGTTSSADFPVTHALQSTLSTGPDVFFAKISDWHD
jgi:hypothetical protein